MGAAGCCTVRQEAVETTPDALLRRSTLNQIVLEKKAAGKQGRLYTQLESLEREWDIVSSSITSQELERLDALRSAVEDLEDHPACSTRPLHKQGQTLLRYLRGRDGDVAKAEFMFRASMDWRHEFGVDDRISEWRQELAEGKTRRARLVAAYGVDVELGLDKMGVPVWLMRLSVSDPAGVLREVGKDVMLVNSLTRMEAMHANLRRAMFSQGRVVRGCIQVLDVGDYGKHGVPNWWTRMMDGFRVGSTAFKIFDGNYPETTRKIFIVRMGRVTSTIYNMALPMIPIRTRMKMRIFGPSAAAWSGELIAELPEGARLPGFLVCDREEAFRDARPAGGLVPVGGEVPEAMLTAARADAESCWVAAEVATERGGPQDSACDLGPHSTRRFPMRAILFLIALVAFFSTARALSLIDFRQKRDEM